jgi:cytoskeletal protein RodZ
MGEPETAGKAEADPSEKKKPSSLRTRIDRVRKSREHKFNFGKLVVAFVALAITGLVIWMIVEGA